MMKIINSDDFVAKHTFFCLFPLVRLCGRVQICLRTFFLLLYSFMSMNISENKWFWRWQLLEFYFHGFYFICHTFKARRFSELIPLRYKIIDGKLLSYSSFEGGRARERPLEYQTQKRIWAQMKIEKLFVRPEQSLFWHFFGFNVLRWTFSFCHFTQFGNKNGAGNFHLNKNLFNLMILIEHRYTINSNTYRTWIVVVFCRYFCQFIAFG